MMQHGQDEHRNDDAILDVDVPDEDVSDVDLPGRLDDPPAELSERDAASRIDAVPDVAGAAAPASGRDDVGPGTSLP